MGGFIFDGVGSVDIGIGGTLVGVGSIGIVGFIGFDCGLFVIAIGLILSKISFIINCGVSGRYEGFTGSIVYLDIQMLE